MKKVLLLALWLASFTSVNAQKITSEELKKYIITMDSLEVLKNQLTTTINNLSKNSKIPGERVSKLMPVINDQAKLSELKATPDEIAHVKKIISIRNEETMKFQRTYQLLISNYLGQDVFTKVRNGLKSDSSLKRKYDSLTAKPIRP